MKLSDIRNLASIGAGTIGSSWATLFAQKGYPVRLYDISEERVQAGLDAIRANLEGMVASDVIRRDEVPAVLERVVPTTILSEAVGDAQFVQESGPERYGIKKEIFADLDRLAPSDAILSTSSSYLQMSEIQKAARFPGRCVNSHPYNPPHIMPLVEIVAGAQTSPETVETDRQLMLRLGKVPVVARKEVYGYIANRLQEAIGSEAMWLVGNGVATADEVDLALRSGPGLRWALMGYFHTATLACAGGMREAFLTDKFRDPKTTEAFAESGLATRPQAEMVPWKMKAIEDMDAALAGQDINELRKWRDAKLFEMLRLLGYLEPREEP